MVSRANARRASLSHFDRIRNRRTLQRDEAKRRDVAGTLYAADLAGMWPLEDINTYYVRDMSGNGRDGYWGTLRGFSLTTADLLSGVYPGADVPSSICNELGYSRLKAASCYCKVTFRVDKQVGQVAVSRRSATAMQQSSRQMVRISTSSTNLRT